MIEFVPFLLPFPLCIMGFFVIKGHVYIRSKFPLWNIFYVV